jgi:hypothetical protein
MFNREDFSGQRIDIYGDIFRVSGCGNIKGPHPTALFLVVVGFGDGAAGRFG